MSPMGTKIYRDSICRTIYNLIRLHGDTTRQYLADTTKLAPTSLNRIIDRLIAAGWITESGLASSTGGRRANLYSQRTEHIAFMVIRLTEDATHLRLYDPALVSIAHKELPSWTGESQPETNAGNDKGKAYDQAQNLRDAVSNLISSLSANRQISSNYGIINHNSGLDSTDLQLIRETIDSLKVDEKIQFQGKLLLPQNCSAYGALWQPASGKLGEATIVMTADTKGTFICQAGDGLRHSGDLRSLTADNLIVPLLQGDKPLTLAKAAQSDGLLKVFSRIKQNRHLTWDDFLKAAANGKKKAAQTMSIAAAACASAIINSAILSEADYWLLTGTMTEELPGLVDETEKQMAALLKKSDILLQRLDAGRSSDQLIWEGAAAKLLEEQLERLEQN